MVEQKDLAHLLSQGHQNYIFAEQPSIEKIKTYQKRSSILESEVKWALESITMNKASGGDGIPVELFQTLKDNAVKVLDSICQQIWKTQQ